MTSFVVVSTDKKKREVYILDYCQNLGIDKFDIAFIEKDSSKNINSIGIDEIKNLQTKIFLKPINSEMKAVILEDAHLLTTEAQNALLKVLEEPPDHTIIILSADSKESLLPTILSRCQIIELETETIVLSDGELGEFSDFIDNIQIMKVGERLKKAEELAKDKDEAINWITKLILALRKKLLENYSSSEPKSNNETIQQFNNQALKLFQSLHTLLKTTNVNPRFAIENTLLDLKTSE